MNIGLKSFAESFRTFLNGAGKYTLFTSLFYSLLLVKSGLLAEDFNLHALPGRMLGIATLQNYDVGARVFLFYKSIAVFLLSFPALNLLTLYFYKKAPALLYTAETRIANYCSLAGVFFLLFEAFGYKLFLSLELVYFMHKLMIVGLLLKKLFSKTYVLTVYHYTISLILSFSLFFVFSDFAFLFGAEKFPNFLMTTFITCCLLIIGILLLFKYRPPSPQSVITKWAYALAPVMAFPLVSVLADETFLVLKNHKIFLNSNAPVFFILELLLGFIIWLRYRKINKGLFISQKTILARHYFPLFIFSWITYAYYNYYFNYTGEVFEAANKYLAIMELKLFGVIPTLEKFNSHLLSDYFFSGIYAFLNGLRGNEIELYDFFSIPFSYLLYYYLLLYVTRNFYIAAFFILIFPLTQAFLPEPYAFGILAIFALNKLISQKQSLKSYLFFFAILSFLVLWRIDLGYACFLVMPALLLFYHFFIPGFRINWKYMLQALAIVSGSVLVFLFVISAYRHINLFEKFVYTLNYLSSAQTYGYSTLGDQNEASYSMHYYIFPVFVVLLIFLLLFRYKELNRSRNQRLAYLSFLFMCGFYIMNFNRGLVRHSLFEWIDHFTSTFVYVILAGGIFIFYYYKPQFLKLIFFCAIAFFSLTNYKLPHTHDSESMLELCIHKVEKYKTTELHKVKSRVKNLPEKKNDKDQPFIDFINKNTLPEETFIDFSNNPMLYFYTKKITPSYFYQNPACSHNDFLQNRFIEDLKNYKTPYLIFSRIDNEGRDNLDDVPNTLRHYRLAEYFYQDYSPYTLAGYLRIWKKNTHTVKALQKTLYFVQKQTGHTIDTLLKTNISLRGDKHYLVRFKVTRKNVCALKATFKTGYDWPRMEYITEHEAYSIIPPKAKTMSLFFEGDVSVIQEFEVTECDVIPDFYSKAFLVYNFVKLPYIWGTYDKLLEQETLLFKKDVSITLPQYKPYMFSLPENIDKTTGNTLILNCSNSTGIVKVVTLLLGHAGDENKTTVTFDVMPSTKARRYAIRISSIYKWYSDSINRAELITESEGIHISDIKITKGS